jgi:hypothetical protein
LAFGHFPAQHLTILIVEKEALAPKLIDVFD